MALSVLSERTITGNRVLLRASSGGGAGRLLGFGIAGAFGEAQDANVTADFGLQRVYQLGQAESAEIVIGAVAHRLTVSRLLLNEADGGFDPRQIVQNGEVNCEIIDRKDGKLLVSLHNGKCGTVGFNVARNGLVSQPLTFEFISQEQMAVD